MEIDSSIITMGQPNKPRYFNAYYMYRPKPNFIISCRQNLILLSLPSNRTHNVLGPNSLIDVLYVLMEECHLAT